MVWCFACTLFVSAALLFMVQPMIGKLVLPLLGGTPAVWNACMVFFQAALLAGYLYAHALARGARVGRQAVIHGVVLLAALLFLPIPVETGLSSTTQPNPSIWKPLSQRLSDDVFQSPPTDANPVFWLLGQLLLTVGLPFFAVAATAPLLQTWFSRTRHPDARDPYFLYSASNIGSLLALLGYPLFIERNFWLEWQSLLWAAGYVLLILLIVACAALALRFAAATAAPNNLTNQETSAISAEAAAMRLVETIGIKRRLRWLLLSAAPASLMLGVTAHITTDIAAVPLLWVVPLALYLLTFILVFAKKSPLPHAWIEKIRPFALVVLGPLTVAELIRLPWLAFLGPAEPWASIALHLLLFFLITLACHGELVRARPGPRHLTEFYLWMSAGGVVGGLFNALLAPVIFTQVWEYPLMLLIAALLPAQAAHKRTAPRETQLDFLLPLALGAGLALFLLVLWFAQKSVTAQFVLYSYGVAAIACLIFRARARRFGLGFGVLLAYITLLVGIYTDPIRCAERNFFGTKRVLDKDGGKRRTFGHGNTIHGVQFMDRPGPPEPLTYYHRAGPLGDVFAALDRAAPPRIAVIGLGIGAVAAYGEPGWHFTFYEIDPAVAVIAEDARYFTFLKETRAAYAIVLGDGRLKIAQAPDQQYDLILLDAFSSDAVPTHLLSREAVQLYLSKLKPGGLLIFQITNQLLNFEPMLAVLAEEQGLACLTRFDQDITPEQNDAGRVSCHFLALARAPADLRALSANPQWRAPVKRPGVAAWTDRYCDLLALLSQK